jgi:hypothetical protein
VSWELRRSGRLVCFFSSRQIAKQAAISFVENLRAQGKAACVAVSAKEELTVRKLEPPACAPQRPLPEF